eukprot:COSAG02_NODE_139_length_34376_cov_233.853663_9_plen_96_part_00
MQCPNPCSDIEVCSTIAGDGVCGIRMGLVDIPQYDCVRMNREADLLCGERLRTHQRPWTVHDGQELPAAQAAAGRVQLHPPSVGTARTSCTSGSR